MSSHRSEVDDTSTSHPRLPDLVIAQAEAAASTNQPEEAQVQPGPTPKTSKDEEDSPPSHASSSKKDPATKQANREPTPVETPIEQVPQVAYGPKLGQVDLNQDGFDTKARVAGNAS